VLQAWKQITQNCDEVSTKKIGVCFFLKEIIISFFYVDLGDDMAAG